MDEDIPLPPITYEDIEATAEEIVEAITNEAISDAIRDTAPSTERKFANEFEDYDLKQSVNQSLEKEADEAKEAFPTEEKVKTEEVIEAPVIDEVIEEVAEVPVEEETENDETISEPAETETVETAKAIEVEDPVVPDMAGSVDSVESDVGFETNFDEVEEFKNEIIANAVSSGIVKDENLFTANFEAHFESNFEAHFEENLQELEETVAAATTENYPVSGHILPIVTEEKCSSPEPSDDEDMK